MIYRDIKYRKSSETSNFLINEQRRFNQNVAQKDIRAPKKAHARPKTYRRAEKDTRARKKAHARAKSHTRAQKGTRAPKMVRT